MYIPTYCKVYLSSMLFTGVCTVPTYVTLDVKLHVGIIVTVFSIIYRVYIPIYSNILQNAATVFFYYY